MFDNLQIDLTKVICHSGGAAGSDEQWALIGKEYGIPTRAYSYKTKHHTSPDKVEISDTDYAEGVVEIHKANKRLNRYGVHKYMNLLARNWSQVKYSNQTFAIGTILKSGERGSKGYYNKSEYDVVDGGTGYCVQMSINHTHEVYVFDQIKDKWFRWSYIVSSFIEITEVPCIIYENFAGVGTRELHPNGLKAIRDVYEKTYKITII